MLKVLIDKYASVVVSSSTSKRVSIYEAATSQPICKAQCGQVTTAMCFSNNLRNLITSTEDGLIFIWKLPELLVKSLVKVKQDAMKLEAEMSRIPSIIEEV